MWYRPQRIASLTPFCGKKDTKQQALTWTPTPFPLGLPLTLSSSETPVSGFFTLLEVFPVWLASHSAATSCGLSQALLLTGAEPLKAWTKAQNNSYKSNRTAKEKSKENVRTQRAGEVIRTAGEGDCSNGCCCGIQKQGLWFPLRNLKNKPLAFRGSNSNRT